MNPGIDSIANEPFEISFPAEGGQAFKFRNVGMGRALAMIGRWLTEKRIEEIKVRSQAFDDSKEKAQYIREQITATVPTGERLAKAAVIALCGDDEFMASKGERGQEPEVDDLLVKKILIHGLVDKREASAMEAAVDRVSPVDQLKALFRVLGLTESAEAAGGDAPKKEP